MLTKKLPNKKLGSFFIFIYPTWLKSWNFDKEAAQNFLSGANDHCLMPWHE